MHRLLVTSDLHQHRTKWAKLVAAALEERPAFVLVAGDILPKYDGFDRQRQFFPRLREHLAAIRDGSGARVLLYLANDDAHYLEPQVDAMEADGLCVNLNQRVGSPALLRFVEENQPLLGCSGHIHESPHQPGGRWMARIGKATWLQPGQVDERLHYAVLDITDSYEVADARHSVLGC